MKRIGLCLLAIACSTILVEAQNPQIAVVRPDGTTYICPTFDSAYNHALNGDNLYLPGGNFIVTNPIGKSLHIYGAGYNPDSSYTTGITTLSPFIVLPGADNGSLEGVLVNANPNSSNYEASIKFGDNQNTTIPLSNYTISKCSISSGMYFYVPSSNITIKNNYIQPNGNGINLYNIAGNISNSLIANNIMTGAHIQSSDPTANLEVNNNLFFFTGYYQQGSYFIFPPNSSVKNNIFQNTTAYLQTQNSYFYNNTNGIESGTGDIVSGYINEQWDFIFINPGTLGAGLGNYNVHNDYHIKSTSLCHNSGTDGTDRGIYGGAFPWQDGSIPSNPHIYFKQVAGQTNSNGQLPIQFKVRTNN